MKNNHLILSLSLAILIVFAGFQTASAAESAWQNLNPGFESGLSGNVHNCVPLTVADGSVAAYPSCVITCNVGFNLSGNTCVAQASGSAIVSSGGGSGGSGGGGGGGSSNVTLCSAVNYSDWGACVGDMRSRTVLSSSPSGCTLTPAQQIATQQSCQSVVSTGSGSSGFAGFAAFKAGKNQAPKQVGGQVAGVKTYPDFTALKDSKTGAIFVIYQGGKYKIKNLKELTLYKIKKTITVDTEFLKTLKDLTKYPVAPKVVKKPVVKKK